MRAMFSGAASTVGARPAPHSLEGLHRSSGDFIDEARRQPQPRRTVAIASQRHGIVPLSSRK